MDDEPQPTRRRQREPITSVVPLTLPRCPRCQRTDSLKVAGTITNTPTRKLQYTICKACAKRFYALWT